MVEVLAVAVAVAVVAGNHHIQAVELKAGNSLEYKHFVLAPLGIVMWVAGEPKDSLERTATVLGG